MVFIFFGDGLTSKTPRKLVLCRVETVYSDKNVVFFSPADAAVLKYTLYRPISGLCKNIRSNWSTFR